MDEALKENLTSMSAWKRAFHMGLFLLLFNISELLLAGVVFIQLGFVVISGKTNPNLLLFGDSLGRYVADIIRFVTYNTEDMPYPFGEWPSTKKA